MITILQSALPDILQTIGESVFPNPIGQGIILIIIFAIIMLHFKIGMPIALLTGMILFQTINLMFPSSEFSSLALNVITFSLMAIAFVVLWMRKK